MSSSRRVGVTSLSAFGLLSLAFGAEAEAQAPATPTTPSSPEKPAQPATTSVSGVVVEGRKPLNQADRRTYDVKSDPDAQRGTAADALNKIPGVSVDANGGLSLRGDSSVKVLINGRETAMVKGENRALTLLSMSGAAISSIEVMTNPSAQFSADGTGGVINIVTRRDAPLGGAGSLRVNAGDRGRYTSAAVASYNTGAITYNLATNLQRNGSSTESASDRVNRNALTGSSVRLLSENHNAFTLEIASVTGGADYRYSDKGTLGGELTLARRRTDFAIDGDTRLYRASGPLSAQYARVSRSRTLRHDLSGSLYWDLRGALTGEGLKVNLSYSRSDEDADQSYGSTYMLPAGLSPSFNQSFRDTDTAVLGFTGDYTKVFGASELKTGWNVQRDEGRLATAFYARSPSTETPVLDPNLSNRFNHAQTVSALYATYERPLGSRWIVMAGLRGEETHIELRQVTTGLKQTDDYFDLFPSLHLTYVVSPDARWRFSYAKRIERPKAQDLNPFVIYRDSQNRTSGNSDLVPQTSQGFEAGYEYGRGQTSYSLSAFYRRTTDLIANASRIIEDGAVVLATRDNLGTMSSLGAEASLTMRLKRKLSLNLSTTIYEARIRSSNLLGPFTRSALIAEYKMNISYRLTPRDSLSLFLFSQGRRLSREENVDPTLISSINYRHDISRQWALSASLQNPLHGMKWQSRTVSDVLQDRSIRSDPGTTFLVGFTRTFGRRG